jgi:hypothetical protein
VPAYFCTQISDGAQTWIAARSEDEAKIKATEQFGTEEVFGHFILFQMALLKVHYFIFNMQ